MMKLSVLFLASCLCYTSALPMDVSSSNKPFCQITFDYRPVCGSDSNTYPNDSVLNCEKNTTPNLEKKSNGRCPAPDQDNMTSVPDVCKCTRNMKPVCGTDGVTYNNKCLLECVAVEQHKEIKVAREGRCH